MAADPLSQWLDALGYSAEPDALHLAGEAIPDGHAYAPELRLLLRPDGDIRARAVYDVEGVPTVAFVDGQWQAPLDAGRLDAIRQRLWNQNLVSVVLSIDANQALALPVQRLPNAYKAIRLGEASDAGPFSAGDFRSSDIVRRLEAWFNPQQRVDRKLLRNLQLTIDRLVAGGIATLDAQVLMGQLLFLAYLEHRGIVSPTYRERRRVRDMHSLIRDADSAGMLRLVDWLRRDFNGDFLATDAGASVLWDALDANAFSVLDQFLAQVDMASGQTSIWNYDFSYIPVELLSGLYESFLSKGEQAALGAYYTPRNLATLAVDEAMRAVDDPVNATVFDGACGSGILLTTALRRIVALHEARDGVQMRFAERCAVVSRQIFGGDLNAMACRVTAFSLYLALLEGLTPADVLALQDEDNVKLPRLTGRNLFSGEAADIFSTDHPLAKRAFTLVLSNPPWTEPEGGTQTSADAYAQATGVPFVRRQSAGLYVFRALDFLRPGGSLCLILPVPLFVGPTSEPFVPAVIARAQPQRLINFGDLQGLLFPTGENACHVFTARKRDSKRIPVDETFDYWVPKADLSLALGRLTLLSADRHTVQTHAVLDDPSWLVTLMWGDALDASLLAGLGARGTLHDRLAGRDAPWKYRKGVHLHDKSREKQSSAPLRAMPHIAIERLREGLPVLHGRDLSAFPDTAKTVVGLNDALLAAFDGPRIVFPDGFSREEAEVRSAFIDGPASFTSSVGVIHGPREDADLLRFLSLYLRSSLAKYFLLMRCWKCLCERNALHLADLDDLPFYAPERAADPARAHAVLARVRDALQALKAMGRDARAAQFADLRPKIDGWVFDYFGLDAAQRRIVTESVKVLLPSVRPRSFRSLDTPAQQRARTPHLQAYAGALGSALDAWRDALGGTGRFAVSVRAMEPGRTGPIGIIRVDLAAGRTAPATTSVQVEDAAVLATVAELASRGITPQLSNLFQLSPDALVWVGQVLYLVRPLARRVWTERSAHRDAERIVRLVQATPTDVRDAAA